MSTDFITNALNTIATLSKGIKHDVLEQTISAKNDIEEIKAGMRDPLISARIDGITSMKSDDGSWATRVSEKTPIDSPALVRIYGKLLLEVCPLALKIDKTAIMDERKRLLKKDNLTLGEADFLDIPLDDFMCEKEYSVTVAPTASILKQDIEAMKWYMTVHAAEIPSDVLAYAEAKVEEAKRAVYLD